MKYLRVEVKICEGCGALWLRNVVSDGVYCNECIVRLAAFPPATGKRPGGRPPTGRPRRRLRILGCCAGHRHTGGAA
jgi:hypothetical protein